MRKKQRIWVKQFVKAAASFIYLLRSGFSALFARNSDKLWDREKY